jgi:hypothetical protein
MKRRLSILLLGFVVSFTTQGRAKQLDSTVVDHWVNLPSAPLIFMPSPSRRDLSLINRSTGRIIKYRLGCLLSGNDNIRVIKRMRLLNTDLLTNRALLNSTSVYENEIEVCSKKSAKIGVVEVVFADGSTWAARGT